MFRETGGKANKYVRLLYSTIKCNEEYFSVIALKNTSMDKMRKVTNQIKIFDVFRVWRQ